MFQEFVKNSAPSLTSRIKFGTGYKRDGLPLGIKGSGGKEKQKTIILRHDVDKLP